MPSTLNKVFLMGNLTRDPEIRYVPSGIAVANMGMALNRVYTNQAKEKKEEVCYVKVVAWARLAEICGEYLTKGSPLFVEGRLQSRSWENEQGQKRTVLEIVADNIQFIGKKGSVSKEEYPEAVPGNDDSNSSVRNNASEMKEESLSVEDEVPF